MQTPKEEHISPHISLLLGSRTRIRFRQRCELHGLHGFGILLGGSDKLFLEVVRHDIISHVEDIKVSEHATKHDVFFFAVPCLSQYNAKPSSEIP